MPLGISKSSAKDQRVVTADTSKGVGAKGRLTESGSFQTGDKSTLEIGNTLATTTATASGGGTVNQTTTDQGAVKGALDLAKETNAGLLSLAGGQAQQQPSVFGSLMGDSAANTVKAVEGEKKKLPPWFWYAVAGVGVVALLFGGVFLFRKKP